MTDRTDDVAAEVPEDEPVDAPEDLSLIHI